jgi:hypothetical protein
MAVVTTGNAGYELLKRTKIKPLIFEEEGKILGGTDFFPFDMEFLGRTHPSNYK